MTEDRTPHPRPVDVELFLAGGHRHQLTLAEDSAELRNVFTAMATGENMFLQLPLREGRAALAFCTAQLVSVTTSPPVLVQPEAAGAVAEVTSAAAGQVEQTRYLVIDDFLSPAEEQALLDYALSRQERFEPGTTLGQRTIHRENMVILEFGDNDLARLLQNRIVTWFPVLADAAGVALFPIGGVESQLTANNDGHYYRMHGDTEPGSDLARVLSCVYYLHRRPQGFSGGELRLYDTVVAGGTRTASRSFRTIEPRSNRLAVFPSIAFHEVCPVRCPSGDFADSRFSVTTWIHRGRPDPAAGFGWGQLRCGVMPAGFA